MNQFYGTLRGEEYKKFVESKGNGSFSADYLSWAVVHDFLKKSFQYVTYKVHEYSIETSNGSTLTVPYMLLPNGTAMVKVTLNVTDMDGDVHNHEECLAIRDFKMKSAMNPDSAQIENTIRRCIAKAGSMLTGFGIELWFGEDIKDLDYHPTIPNFKELDGNTGGEVKTVPQHILDIKTLSRAVEFKGTGLQTKIIEWLETKNPSKDEVMEKYIKMKDQQIGIQNAKKKEKK